MQTLYTLLPLDDHKTNLNEALRRLHKHFDNSLQLLLYLLQTMVHIAQYANIDAQKKAAKNLPTTEDLSINTRIANTPYLQSIISDRSFIAAVEKYKIDSLIQQTLIKTLYVQLVQSDQYKIYTNNVSVDKKIDREMFIYIINDIMLNNEVFIAHTEDVFANIDDDIDVLQSIIMKYLQKPGCVSFEDILGIEKRNFADELLQTVIHKTEYLATIITPKLKNWDADRIAILDMILLKMGLAEMLYFNTIPVKVTINEYIDIAKEYSTKQSGQFINGILDNIHKDLIAQGKINKVDFKQS